LKVRKALNSLLEILTRHRLYLKSDLFLVIKALGTVEGLGKRLDPEFEIIRHAQPFIKQIQWSRLNPKNFFEDMIESGSELIRLLKEIPGEINTILHQAKKGRIKIEFEHMGLEPMLSTLDRTSNRIAFAIVLASLVIGSSLIVLSDIPPKWHEIPIIGLVGFIIAGVMGFWLLVSIMRRGKM